MNTASSMNTSVDVQEGLVQRIIDCVLDDNDDIVEPQLLKPPAAVNTVPTVNIQQSLSVTNNLVELIKRQYTPWSTAESDDLMQPSIYANRFSNLSCANRQNDIDRKIPNYFFNTTSTLNVSQKTERFSQDQLHFPSDNVLLKENQKTELAKNSNDNCTGQHTARCLLEQNQRSTRKAVSREYTTSDNYTYQATFYEMCDDNGTPPDINTYCTFCKTNKEC